MKIAFVAIALVSLNFLISCKEYDKRYIIAKSFLTNIENEKYDAATAMLSKSVFDSSYTKIVTFYMFNTHDLLKQYGIPTERKWQSEIDARNIETIEIPLYEGKGINHKYTNIILCFDESGYAKDSIVNFEIITRRK